MSYPSVSAIEYQSADAMRRAAVALHKRLWSRRAVPQVLPVVKPVEIEPEPVDPVSQYRTIVVIEEHESEYVPALPGTAKQFLLRRCREVGVDYHEIIGPCRTTQLVAIRRQLIVEVYVKYPGMGTPRIGKLFRKDHSSIHHAVVRAGVWRPAIKPKDRP